MSQLDALLNRVACLGSHAQFHPVTPLTTCPRVTVVVPCYNYGRYLPGCVESILQQSHVEVEIVIVDDASTDGSGEIATELERQDPRVIVIKHTANRGHIATFNDGLARGTGEYVVMLSADDLLTPGSLSRAVSLMEAHPSVGMVYGPVIPFDSSVPPRSRDAARQWLIWSGAEWLAERFRKGQCPTRSPEVMLRMSVQREIGGYRTEVPHTSDLDTWLRAAHVSDVGYIAGADQAWYREHAMSMHRTMFLGETVAGRVVDARERARTFELVARTVIDDAPVAAELLDRSRRAIAIEALTDALRPFYWGQAANWPVEELVGLAEEIYPRARRLPLWNVVALHRRMGQDRPHRDPVSRAHERAVEALQYGRRWRLERAGV